ncbi:Ig-like domain-containing protein [Spirosoma radiotolerans]|uniref:Ig-like domain-containing protein n=1 Tax=Spirosoma radiotolerans TaxID=1379870 RepID=UPI000A7D511D|nr:T9SS type A sorting domain-containing protein [Spirosoma radiotolerans]
MIPSLYDASRCTRLCQWLFIGGSCLAFLLGSGRVLAQQLDTQPLAVTSVCAGADIEVKGVKSAGGISFTVELSDGGGTYREIPSALIASSGRYEFTCRATIPASTPAGNNYRIRIVSRNPDVVGTPSISVLTVKAKPAPPTIPNPPSDCQFIPSLSNTNTNSSYSIVGVSSLIPASTVDFYGADGAKIIFTLSQYGDINASSRTYTSTYLLKNEPGSKTYFVTQSIEECASEKVAFQFTTLARAKGGPTVMTMEKTSVAGVGGIVSAGLIDVCQGGNSLNFNDLPVKAEPGFYSGFCEVTQSRAINTGDQVRICDKNSTSIKTDSIGKRIFRLYSISNNPDNYCTNHPNSDTYLVINVKARPAKPVVAASSLTLCQSQTASPLSATATDAGGSLVWYGTVATGGTSSTIASQPSTATVGTFTYYVAQRLNDCESERVEIKVVIKPAPALPGTTALSVCQNEPAKTLSATGENLRWYTSPTDGSGSATAPTLATDQATQVTYYVSQTLDGCEGPRAALSTTVNALPTAPGITPKNLCQFATPERLSAVGEGLTWYTPDGLKLASAPLINTDNAASFTVLVTQTVNGCEGPKATATATVQAAPAPVVSKTTVEVCQGTPLQPLDAAGANLKWIDPNGNVTSTAPTPPTANATVKAEGDVYYVTQTSPNGCESPKVAIHVFVQTTPTVSILGTTTANLGIEVPLKLMFTGVGPYRFRFSNGLSGASVKDTTLLVLPDHTTTYQVMEVANKCGTVLPGTEATATVTVLIPSIETLAIASSTLCAGTSLTTNFITTGTLNPGSIFRLQVASVETDTAKINFVDIPSSLAADGKLIGTIPSNTPGGAYWIRVTATNPKIPIKGSISPTRLTIQARPTATLTGNQTIYEGQPATLSVAFSGDGPWKFSYHDSTATGVGNPKTVSTSSNPYVFEARPVKTTSYLLTSASNGCGEGTILRQLAVVNLIPLLGVDDQSLASNVTVYPVPASTTLTVQINGLSITEPALVEITDLTGQLISRQQTRQAVSSLTLDHYPVGTYVLRIKVGDRTASKRIIKF